MFRHADCDFAWVIAMIRVKTSAGMHFDIKEIIFNDEGNRRKALRVIPRGKQRLTVYRAHQVFDVPGVHMTCRAFLSCNNIYYIYI